MNPTVEQIKHHTAKAYEIDLAVFVSPRRSANIARPRMVAMYLSRQLTKRSLAEIGNYFGGRDHTTTLHACRRINELMLESPEFSERIAAICISICDCGAHPATVTDTPTLYAARADAPAHWMPVTKPAEPHVFVPDKSWMSRPAPRIATNVPRASKQGRVQA